MKKNVPSVITLTIGLMAAAPLMSYAQTTLPPLDSRTASIPAVSVTQAGNSRTIAPREEEYESITVLLSLASSRIAQLDRAYSTYARARLLQEAQIANWQEDLRTAQSATNFNERKASLLSANISGAENKTATAYLKARGEALAALTAVQRVRLEKLEAENRPVRDDKYRFLLLSQVEDLWRTPIDSEVGQALLSAAASKPPQQNYYQSYYSAPPVYASPYYGSYYGSSYYGSPYYNSYSWNNYSGNYDWDNYSYGFPYPFYARPTYGGNGSGYDGNYRLDKNARARWDRSDSDSSTRPPVNYGYGSTRPQQSPEPRRPLYTPQNPGDRVTPVTPKGGMGNTDTRPSSVLPPQADRRPEPPAAPVWERQRESPRPEPTRPDPPHSEPTRPEPSRPEPPKSEPRPEPPRSEPKRPEQSSGDAGSRWNRGGGGRGR